MDVQHELARLSVKWSQEPQKAALAKLALESIVGGISELAKLGEVWDAQNVTPKPKSGSDAHLAEQSLRAETELEKSKAPVAPMPEMVAAAKLVSGAGASTEASAEPGSSAEPSE